MYSCTSFVVFCLCIFLGVQPGGGPFAIFRGGQYFSGQIDAHGEFVPIRVEKYPVGANFGPDLLERSLDDGTEVFEYRSGAIIPGVFRGDLFVPRCGYCVSRFQRSPDKVIEIYNLPDALGGGPRARWFGVFKNRPRPVVPPDVKRRCRGLGEFGAAVFVQDLTPRVHHKWGDKVYVGNLDTYGRFIPDPLVPPQDPAKFAGIVPTSRPLMLGPDGRREVYEFRAGRLVPGKLTDDDRFVPQVGGLIIHIRDYVYTPEARPIYNLPGRFYPKGMKINVAGGEVPVEKIGNRWDLYPP